MIPKVGETVRMSKNFIDNFKNSCGGYGAYKTWMDWFDQQYGDNIEILVVKISANLGFSVRCRNRRSDLEYEVELTSSGALTEWHNEINMPFFTYEQINPKSNSNLYCSCMNPKLKDVCISASIWYKFCQDCKKERQ
jgi:hypothetical protein